MVSKQLTSGLTLLALGVVLQGCASNKSAQQLLEPDPPDKSYATAEAYMTAGKWEKAAERYETLDKDHPYAPEARRAIVMAAYAYYRAGKCPEAIATARRFTTMHPGSPDAAFAHHTIAMCYFEDMRGPNRDQSATRKALAEFKTLKSRYPTSKYAEEADNRIRICEDSLAASEMEVGRYYLKKGNHVASINRFKVVVSDYPTTKHVEEALMRLTESYMALGITNEAQNAAAVLGYNFPNSPWYKDAYDLLQTGGLEPREDSGSWLNKAWKSIQLPKLTLGG